MDVRFLGHSCFSLSDGDTTVVIDPFLTGNPKAAISADEIDPTAILLTHGHADHIGDSVAIAKRNPIDIALMCIGGHYTMDRFDAVDAADLVGARTVIPCHYNTFPPIETDAQAFKSDVESATSASVIVLDPGETHST